MATATKPTAQTLANIQAAAEAIYRHAITATVDYSATRHVMLNAIEHALGAIFAATDALLGDVTTSTIARFGAEIGQVSPDTQKAKEGYTHYLSGQYAIVSFRYADGGGYDLNIKAVYGRQRKSRIGGGYHYDWDLTDPIVTLSRVWPGEDD